MNGIFKDGFYILKHNFGYGESYTCKYKAPNFQNKNTKIIFENSCKYKFKRKVSMLKYGEQYAEAVRDLFEHMVIWYPNYDEDMANNRGVKVRRETLRLKGVYQKIRDLFLSVEQ